MPIFRKLQHWFIGIVSIIAVLCVLAAGICYWISRKSPEELTEMYLADFIAQSGLKISFDSINFNFLPLPAISLGGLKVESGPIRLVSPWVTVQPNLAALFTGSFFPSRVYLLRPRAHMRLPFPVTDPSKLDTLFKDSFGKFSEESDSMFNWEKSCEIKLIQGYLFFKDSAGTKSALSNLNSTIELTSGGDVDARFSLTSFSAGFPDSPLVTLQRAKGNLRFNTRELFTGNTAFNLEGTLSARNALAPSVLNIAYEGNSDLRLANFSFGGNLELGGKLVPMAIQGKASSISTNEIYLRAVEFNLDNDNGRLDMQISLPSAKQQFQLQGSLSLHRLSLTQWFGFARNLAPGLQLSLDNIMKAAMNFKIDAKGLEATNIRGFCCGSEFRGSGGVASFAKPVVLLRMRTKHANLGLALPESLGKNPLPPVFPYPPLTPMPGEPLAEGETGIGYDIRLFADNLTYGKLNLQKSSLRIYPGKMDVTRLEDVLLDAHAAFYGGQITGNCILGADKSLPINIVVKGRDINGQKLGKDLEFFPFGKGIFETYINVFSEGKELNIFLPHLRGVISGRGQKAAFSNTSQYFSSVRAKLELKTANLSGTNIGFTGKWNASLTGADYDAIANLNGRIFFGEHGLSFSDLPGDTKIKFLKKLDVIPANTELSLTGNANYRGDKVELRKASVNFLGLKIALNGQLDTKKMTWQGDFSTHIPQLESIGKKLGLAMPQIPPALGKVALKSAFSGNNDGIKLSSINSTFGNINITGQLEYKKRASKPYIGFTLETGAINTGDVMESGKGASSWNYPFIREFDSEGSLKIKSVKFYNLGFTNLSTNIKLAGGVLTIPHLTCDFYSGKVKANAKLDFNKGLGITAHFDADNFNIASLAADRKMDVLLKGVATMKGTVKLDLHDKVKVVPQLNGDWSLNARDGSWQSMEKGQPSGKPTTFKSLTASGVIEHGVIRGNNFSLTDSGLKVTGTGWLNLINDKVDLKLNVDMKGLPDFPLYVYGSLANPTTSIGAGRMVMNALGGITTGVGNIFSGIANGIGSLFK